ncbi:tryptophan--tRNA ligase [Motiliproteus sp. SC1-56]|uniref:tryptophan--tRNA ligase n=1 Tax=Motiliproteus sp. SC1-56 TaxID=2799565 RepID=UPI001A8F39A6|nr:tryptophan--tRNA ligase [Motiliproteus sp. SC1-56]
MSNKRVLTGITTTGTPHLGNYLGAIKPAVRASQDPDLTSFFFLADFHALIKCQDPERVARSTREIAATWLALGLDTDNATFYRQSDIPEIAELNWILSCLCSKGLMNRAHAYKAAVDENRNAGKEDLDDGVTMGLFSYPVLMAADILMFNARHIPVGKDQIQHIEMARDMAGRFNHLYADLFVLPEPMVEKNPLTISGLDGRKMSKSYDNTIPLFCSEQELRRLINQIVTDSREPGEPKDPYSSTIFELYALFASEHETELFRKRFLEGIAWGEAKAELFEYLNAYLKEPRERYHALMNNLDEVETLLQKGAEKARAHAAPFMEEIRGAVGIRSLNAGAASRQTAAPKKEKSAEEVAAEVERKRRSALMFIIKPVLEQVEAAEDQAAVARQVIEERTERLQGLKKKARQKAENELNLLREELARYLG